MPIGIEAEVANGAGVSHNSVWRERAGKQCEAHTKDLGGLQWRQAMERFESQEHCQVERLWTGSEDEFGLGGQLPRDSLVVQALKTLDLCGLPLFAGRDEFLVEFTWRLPLDKWRLRKPCYGILQVHSTQQKALIAILCLPFPRAHEEAGVSLLPIWIAIERVDKAMKGRFESIRIPKIDSLNPGQDLLNSVVRHIPAEDRDQALSRSRGMCDLPLADLQGDRIGADHEDEVVGSLDAGVDLAEPLGRSRNVFPVDPWIPVEGSAKLAHELYIHSRV